MVFVCECMCEWWTTAHRRSMHRFLYGIFVFTSRYVLMVRVMFTFAFRHSMHFEFSSSSSSCWRGWIHKFYVRNRLQTCSNDSVLSYYHLVRFRIGIELWTQHSLKSLCLPNNICFRFSFAGVSRVCVCVNACSSFGLSSRYFNLLRILNIDIQERCAADIHHPT